ncbi:hypothetical protein TNCV_2046881 [Trichonephila clavipes]|uniref:Uncharacterized protein n=1 Tax=Trichonephila clavipes TaxID=2585209 RepID=A0A8X6SZF8_TRICX|nr:hypothetical protein TNCV_2046881 [Trichonephila clavipes]
MYIKSTTCYSYVRDKGSVIVPSVRQLQKVASGLNVTPGLSTLANENYLRDESIDEESFFFLDNEQGRSYHRIKDTGPPSYRSPNMCNYSPTNRAPISKKGPEGILIQGTPQR